MSWNPLNDLKRAFGGVKNELNGLGHKIRWGLDKVRLEIIKNLRATGNLIEGGIKRVGSEVEGGVRRIGHEVESGVKHVGSEIEDGIQKVASEAKEEIEEKFNDVKNELENLDDEIKDKLEDVLKLVVKEASSAAFKSFLNTVKRVTKNASDDVSIGFNIGPVSFGVSDFKDKIEAVETLVNKGINGKEGIKELITLLSPSDVTLSFSVNVALVVVNIDEIGVGGSVTINRDLFLEIIDEVL